MDRSAGYSNTQIALHWVTVFLVALQYLLHEGVAVAFDEGLETGQMALTVPAVGHMAGGLVILALAIWRLLLRQERPEPPPPEGEPRWAAWLAPVAHRLFYALLIALPVTGGLAWGTASETLSDMHEALRAALLALIVAHVGAVILHQAVWKTGLLTRMTRPGG